MSLRRLGLAGARSAVALGVRVGALALGRGCPRAPRRRRRRRRCASPVRTSTRTSTSTSCTAGISCAGRKLRAARPRPRREEGDRPRDRERVPAHDREPVRRGGVRAGGRDREGRPAGPRALDGPGASAQVRAGRRRVLLRRERALAEEGSGGRRPLRELRVEPGAQGPEAAPTIAASRARSGSNVARVQEKLASNLSGEVRGAQSASSLQLTLESDRVRQGRRGLPARARAARRRASRRGGLRVRDRRRAELGGAVRLAGALPRAVAEAHPRERGGGGRRAAGRRCAHAPGDRRRARVHRRRRTRERSARSRRWPARARSPARRPRVS